jgi:hypothetical protein
VDRLTINSSGSRKNERRQQYFSPASAGILAGRACILGDTEVRISPGAAIGASDRVEDFALGHLTRDGG